MPAARANSQGLLAIRAYHESRGDQQRRICLIPSSAHGTNAASATMAGLKVVVVKAAADGAVDLEDLRTKISDHRDQLAAIMVTYPSTHGVFEEGIVELCSMVHEAGGQVLRRRRQPECAARSGATGQLRCRREPPESSQDLLHPARRRRSGRRARWRRRPSGTVPAQSPVARRRRVPATGIGPISAAPYGSAGILPISYAYIAMMGADGLTSATEACAARGELRGHAAP